MKICTIDGCGMKVHSIGLCASHYKRLKRHGDPLKGPVKRGVPMAFFMKTLSYTGDECVSWPYAHRGLGRGAIHWQGKTQKVHRVMCQEVNGQPPSDSHHAAHNCGNGHLGCITPKHLSWKTAKENEADKELHGTRKRGTDHHNAKLTAENVLVIRKMSNDGLSIRKISELYGVSEPCISRVVRNLSYKSIT